MVIEIFVKKTNKTKNYLEQQSVDLLADTFSGGWGVCVCFCVVFPLYNFLSPSSRLARHLQKEAQSQHNNSEFTEDQKVSIAVCSVKELDSQMLMCIMFFLSRRPEPCETFFPPSIYANRNRVQHGCH